MTTHRSLHRPSSLSGTARFAAGRPTTPFAVAVAIGMAAACCLLAAEGVAAEDVVVEDFESDSYRGWTVTGEAFGTAPVVGSPGDDETVPQFRGRRLVDTAAGGDRLTGTATGPVFTIQRSHLAFLLGGGRDASSLGVALLVDGEPVRSATGSGEDRLLWTAWDVSRWDGREARLRIIDRATGTGGSVRVDHIIQTNEPPGRFGLRRQLEEYRRRADYLDEPLRPQYHFSPEVNWMNDPNGLVYHAGEYHLFHQYNPGGNRWGNMSWGHAVSRDLTHWEHLPVAIADEDGVMAFSGCCVVDTHNSSGFGQGAKPPLMAIYTGHGHGHGHGKQVQNLAFSNDRGRTWTKYDGNPVIDRNQDNFRDPKVFWHEPTQRWVMVVSLASEKVLLFYRSTDLRNWEEVSRFGPAGTLGKPNWECPDLFELPIEGEPGRSLWVLEVDLGAGSIAGGSGGEYFVGRFDGVRFEAIQQSQWVDYGRDFYAPISWDNIPESDGRRLWIGWFNNWQTPIIPTSPWRSCMSLPRRLSLKKVAVNREEPATYVLNQSPVEELNALRTGTRQLDAAGAAWPPKVVVPTGRLEDRTFELLATVRPGEAQSIGIRIRTGSDKSSGGESSGGGGGSGAGEYTEIGYDRRLPGVYVDRTRSGNVGFHPAFPGRHIAPARLVDGRLDLRIYVDRSTIEVFVNGGEAVISDRIFPTGDSPAIEVFSGDPSGRFDALTLHPLRSIWRDRPQPR